MRRSGFLLGLIAAMALVMSTIPAAAQTLGSISGTVTNKDTGEPIDNELVAAFSKDYGDSTYTDHEGHYVFRDLPEGDFWVGAGRSASLDDSVWATTWWPGVADHSAAEPVTVVAGEENSGIDLALEYGGVVTGKVIDAWTGDLVPDAWIGLDERSDGNWVGGTGYNLDTDGTYRIGGLRGEYRITAVDGDAFPNVERIFTIAAGEELNIDLAMTPAYGTPYATVSGFVCEVDDTVTGCIGPAAQENLLTGISVEARSKGGALLGNTTTDAWGWFRLEELDPGTIVVSAIPPAGMELVGQLTFDLGPNEEAWETELMLRRIPAHLAMNAWMTPGVAAPGEVTKLQVEALFNSVDYLTRPFDLTGVVVAIHLPEGITYQSHSGDGRFDPSTGQWSIPSLPFLGSAHMTITVTGAREGMYRAHAEIVASDWPDPSSWFGDGKGADYAEAALVVEPSPEVVVEESVIAGLVWLDSNGDGSMTGDEHGIEGVTVRATRADGMSATATTSSEGEYRLAGLPAGTYRVTLDSTTLPDGVVPPTTPHVTMLGPETVVLDADFVCIVTAGTVGWWILGGAIGLLVLGAGLGLKYFTHRLSSLKPGDETSIEGRETVTTAPR